MTDESGSIGDSSGPDENHRSPARVREVYEEIAAHFAETRHHPWPEVDEFLDEVPPGTVGLDVGCGNGRHAELLAERVKRVLALDVSRNLLEETRTRLGAVGEGDSAQEKSIDSHEITLLQGDAAHLPLADGSVDLGLYVATLHHLPDRETRQASLDELARVLDADGRALVSAWSTAHERFDSSDDSETGFDATIDWTLPGGEDVPRFYHIYAPQEFEADVAASDLELSESYVSSGNCYAEVRAEK